MQDRSEGGHGERFWTVGELARELGITPRTIRFYEDRGLILPRRAGATRIYAPRDRARMILILRGKRLGFSLREIKDYLELYAVDRTGAEQLRLLLGAARSRIGLLEQQAAAIAETLSELRHIEREADRALAEAVQTVAA